MGAERRKAERLCFKVISSEELLLFDSEVDFFVFESRQNLIYVCTYHLVLVDLSVLITIEMAVQGLAFLIGYVILDVRGSTCRKLWIARQCDLDFVRF